MDRGHYSGGALVSSLMTNSGHRDTEALSNYGNTELRNYKTTQNCFDTLMTQMHTDDTDEKAELRFFDFFNYRTA
jgi:hypothetical protein